MTGLHALHVIIGMGVLSFVLNFVLRGKVTAGANQYHGKRGPVLAPRGHHLDLPVPAFLPDLLRREPVTYPRYILIWAGLVVLTAITVTTASLNFGRVGILVVLAIAAIKSTLVLLYFMHLLLEKRLLLKILVPIAICTLAIFIGLTYTDVLFR